MASIYFLITLLLIKNALYLHAGIGRGYAYGSWSQVWGSQRNCGTVHKVDQSILSYS
jgi:hypothetical protein